MKALARFVGAVPDHDHPIELHDLLFEAEQLIAERGKAHAGNLRHPFVTRVGNNMEQFGGSPAPDRRDPRAFFGVSFLKRCMGVWAPKVRRMADFAILVERCSLSDGCCANRLQSCIAACWPSF
jgi:hypothetical protein